MYYLLYGRGKTINSIKKYFDFNNLKYVQYFDIGYNNNVPIEVLNNIDCIVKSPGIKPDVELLNIARSLNIKIISDLELCWILYPNNEYVIITGTNGKTTTTTLISEMLEINPFFKDGPAGNIGIPIFDKLVDNRNRRGMIIEASSFMLHNTYSLIPNVYVITNLLSHHLDFHKIESDYFNDKVKLIINMKDSDYLVYNRDDENIISYINNINSKTIAYSVSLYNKEADCYIKDNFIYFRNNKFISLDNLYKKDEGTLYDMMLAILVAKVYHIKNDHIKKVITNFKGVEYRLEMVYNKNDLIIFNDSKSTSPHATYPGIKYLNEKYSNYFKTIIIGGKMIDNNYDIINEEIAKFDLIYVYGSSKYDVCQLINGKLIKVYDYLEEVINDLDIVSRQIVLFSPTCVSYDQYCNFEDRGKKFNKLIKNKTFF